MPATKKDKPFKPRKSRTIQTSSLAVTHKKLSAQWHPFYNQDKKPADFTHGSVFEAWWVCPRAPDHVFRRMIVTRSRSTASHMACPYCSGAIESIVKPLRKPSRKFKKSILDTHLAVAAQWDFEKNGWWVPEDFTAGSRFEAWWNCPLGHNFQTKISARTGTKCLSMGCPGCVSLAWGAYNREREPIIVTHPLLAEQWDRDLNGSLTTADVTRGSAVKVWWHCPKGPDHNFLSAVYNRTRSATKTMACPFCAGKRPSVTNSLASLFPDLLEEYSNRNKIDPSNIVAKSGKKVWWICKACAFEWQAVPAARICNNSGCRRCNSGEPIDLRKMPQIAKLFDRTKNKGANLANLSKHETYWWRCKKAADHVFQSGITKRILKEKCPYCRNMKASSTNSLAKHYPAVAKQLHPTKNGKVTAHDLVYGSAKTVWWQCPVTADHQWKAIVSTRTVLAYGCPFCAGKRASKDINLAKTHPEIARQFHKVKNVPLTARDFLAGSKKRVWWLCKNGHEFETSVMNRTRSKVGCLICKQTILPKEATMAASLFKRGFSQAEIARRLHINVRNIRTYLRRLELIH
ncbi:hypothetical protein KBI23_27075 [bacterium]|nr:hypothetical protein [bacterium]